MTSTPSPLLTSMKPQLKKELSSRVEETLRTSGLADVLFITDDGAERIRAHQASET